jgi:hypothetical protein
MNQDTAIVWSFIQGIFYLILIIVFFVMTSNIGAMVKLLGAILLELKEANAKNQKQVN